MPPITAKSVVGGILFWRNENGEIHEQGNVPSHADGI